jgi:hypothetical protein
MSEEERSEIRETGFGEGGNASREQAGRVRVGGGRGRGSRVCGGGREGAGSGRDSEVKGRERERERLIATRPDWGKASAARQGKAFHTLDTLDFPVQR